MREPVSRSVLIVDDNKLDQQLLRVHLEPQGYELTIANDGVEAMELLLPKPLRFDVVLLDRTMPRMDGMEVLRRIKVEPHLRALPVIFQTALNDRDNVLSGIRAGAYYYLTKPYDHETLIAIVDTATRDFAEYRKLQRELRQGLECLRLIESARFVIRTVEQARDTAAVLANACPDPAAAVIGLTELLVNAVEHGNLGITYEEKTQLNASGGWDREVKRRLALPENSEKRVICVVERSVDEICFTICDDGSGFPWNGYLDVDPRRALDNHGRGIAIARAVSFDSVEYRGKGNEVVARVKL